MKVKKMIGLGVSLIVSVLLFFSCRSTAETSETSVTSRTTESPKDVVKTVNPNKPLKNDWDLKAKKVWEISDLAGKTLSSPMITVSDDEITYIYEGKSALNFILDKDGKLIKTFGNRGQGPGEVAHEAFFFPVQDKLVIFDFPNRLHFFHKNGEFIKAVNIGITDMPYAFISEYEYISAPPPGMGDSKIKYINLKTGEKRVIREIKYNVPIIQHQRNVIVAMPGLTGLMKLGFDQENQRIYYGINDQYHIYIADLQGNMISSFSVQRERAKISRDIKKKTVSSQLQGMPPEVIEKSLKLLPDEITYFHKIQIEDGLVYAFREDCFGANWEYQEIDIFSLDGKYLYRARFKPGEGKTIYNSYNYSDIIYMKKGALYLSLEDSQGEIFISKYEISLPAGD